MDQTPQPSFRASERTDWLCKGPLAPHLDAYTRHLTERGYAERTVDSYRACLAHFSQWAHRRRQNAGRIDEARVAELLDEHLPHCNCAAPVRSDRRDLCAALGHLLVVRRALGIDDEPSVNATPVDEEPHRFEHARGLVPKTRSMALDMVAETMSSSTPTPPLRKPSKNRANRTPSALNST
jgi:Phage integrase, N-terminal SAM-like domain